MEGRLAAGKAGAIRLKRVDMVWIWNVYSFGDKFRIIAKLSKKSFGSIVICT